MSHRPNGTEICVDVVVTAVGVCTPLGHSIEEFWRSIAAGEHGFQPMDRMKLTGLPTTVACGFDGPTVDALCAEAGEVDPALAFAVLAGRRALAQANLTTDQLGHLPLIVGSSAGAADLHQDFEDLREIKPEDAALLIDVGSFHSMAPTLCAKLGLTGPRTAISTACASGGHALGLGTSLLRGGLTDRVLVLTTDSVHPWLFAGFSSVGALAMNGCAPFGLPEGMSLGEGAAAVLLETRSSAEARASSVFGSLLGWSGSTDAFHATSPEPRGTGIARSIEGALRNADVRPAQVDYYNAHGTGTQANDSAETLGILQSLGEDIPVSSTKSQLGHTQGSAGLLEAITTWLAIRHQALPPSLGSMPPRRVVPADTVSGPHARPARIRAALSNSSAFGGTNVTLLMGPPDAGGSSCRPTSIFARGSAIIDRSQADTVRPRGKLGRGMDPVSRILTVATSRALKDAGCRRNPRNADRIGQLIGMADGPQTSHRAFVDSGTPNLGMASAAAFSRMVMNAPTGAAALALQLRGPSITLWSGPGAGHQAIFLGSTWLSVRDDLDLLVAGGADEVGTLFRDRARMMPLPAEPSQGAGVLVLSRTSGDARLAASAWAGPQDWKAVVQRACGGRIPDRVLLSFGPHYTADRAQVMTAWEASTVTLLEDCFGYAPAACGAIGACTAVAWIKERVIESALVLSISRDSGAVATFWVQDEGGL